MKSEQLPKTWVKFYKLFICHILLIIGYGCHPGTKLFRITVNKLFVAHTLKLCRNCCISFGLITQYPETEIFQITQQSDCFKLMVTDEFIQSKAKKAEIWVYCKTISRPELSQSIRVGGEYHKKVQSRQHLSDHNQLRPSSSLWVKKVQMGRYIIKPKANEGKKVWHLRELMACWYCKESRLIWHIYHDCHRN